MGLFFLMSMCISLKPFLMIDSQHFGNFKIYPERVIITANTYVTRRDKTAPMSGIFPSSIRIHKLYFIVN